MFNFSNIKKLFSYNWPNTVKKIVPKGNKSVIDKQSYQNIRNGAIVRIMAVVFSKIAVIGLAVWVVVAAYKNFLGNELIGSVVFEVLKENAMEYIGDIIASAIIPIIILIYTVLMKDKQQNGWPYFIVLIYCLIQTALSLWDIFTWVPALITSPIFAIIGLVSVCLFLLGNIHTAVGCIDFCTSLVPAESTNTQSFSNSYGNQNTQSIPNQNGYVNTQGMQQPINYANVSQPVSQEMQYSNNIQQPSYQPQQNVVVNDESMPGQVNAFSNNNQNVFEQPNTTINNQNLMNQQNVNQPNVINQQNLFNAKKYCPNCGSQVDSNDTTCFMCGKNC